MYRPKLSPFTVIRNNGIYGDNTEIPDDIFFKGSKIGAFHVYIDRRYDSVIVFNGSREKGGPEKLFVWNTEYRSWQELPVERFLGFSGWIGKKEDDD